MCEIALIVFLCRSLGESLRAKGRNPIFFQTLFALGWFPCEIGGAILFVGMGRASSRDDAMGIALAGGLLGVVFWSTAFFVVTNLLARKPVPRLKPSELPPCFQSNNQGYAGVDVPEASPFLPPAVNGAVYGYVPVAPPGSFPDSILPPPSTRYAPLPVGTAIPSPPPPPANSTRSPPPPATPAVRPALAWPRPVLPSSPSSSAAPAVPTCGELNAERRISWPCPSCTHRLSAQPKFAGKKSNCPHCKQVVVIPSS